MRLNSSLTLLLIAVCGPLSLSSKYSTTSRYLDTTFNNQKKTYDTIDRELGIMYSYAHINGNTVEA